MPYWHFVQSRTSCPLLLDILNDVKNLDKRLGGKPIDGSSKEEVLV